MSDNEENEIVFEKDVDTSNDDFEVISTKQKQIMSQPTDDFVYHLHHDWQKGSLIIQPSFQRQYVWDPQKATSLIESALIGIPLPVIYLAEEENGKRSVIDGQQRLTAFFSFIENRFPDGANFKLRRMQVFPELKGKTFSELDDAMQNRIYNCPIRTITFMMSCDPQLKFNVFERLNTGAVSLNDQELRNCVYRGEYNDLIKELATDSDFKSIIGIEGKERRMLDVELVLRFCAFLNKTYLNYKPPMKSFLNEDMRDNLHISKEKAERIKTAFKNTVSLVKSMRGERAFRRFVVGNRDKTAGEWESRRFSASLYDILMFGFANKDKNLVMRNLDSINEAFIDLMSNNEVFRESIEMSTSSQQAVQKRFDIWRMTLDAILCEDSKQPRCFSKALKQSLFDNNPTCAICGQEIKTIDDAAIDHIEQYWRGGKTIPENARLVHRYCNCHRNKND